MATDYTIESQPDYNFDQFSINSVPLTGLTYKIDAGKVRQLIQGFVQGETKETWINPKERNKDGILDYSSLLAHYRGKGNKAVRIKEADALSTLLIYKNCRAVSFKKSLTNMQKMFAGLSENGEILNDSQKIRLIFQKVKNPILTQIKASLQVSYDLDQSNTVTYAFISNSLVSEAASIGYHKTQGVKDVNTCGEKVS